jgi:predicted nucleotidyltransferase component of viral defense system
MASSPPNRLTLLQRDLLDGFFAREKRFFLTGGGALAGFYFGHRDTEDIDLFAAPGVDLAEAARSLEEAAAACGATVGARSTHADFRRLVARRGDEECVVDLVIDRAPMVEPEKARFGEIRVDTLREIAANKICTLLSRSEPKDLVDLRELVNAGVDLERAFADAEKKDAGADPATLAWILEEVRISPHAALPGGVDPAALAAFRDALLPRLRALAFARVRR